MKRKSSGGLCSLFVIIKEDPFSHPAIHILEYLGIQIHERPAIYIGERPIIQIHERPVIHILEYLGIQTHERPAIHILKQTEHQRQFHSADNALSRIE